ncbi:MAG: hypothetical protein P4N59_09995 [Negativicutes bacterium]|nr:hypothetical protein [Negativicutes bacterium]
MTKHPVDLKTEPPFVLLSGFGLVGGVDPVGRLLQKPADDGGGRFEDGRAHQHLQLLDRQARGLIGLKAGHQPSEKGSIHRMNGSFWG